MRQLSSFLQALLDAGGPFIGDDRASTRITVQPDWWLQATWGSVGNWPASKTPIRWWQRKDNSQVEIEIPNIQHVVIDRTLTQDAATMTVDMYNTQMPPLPLVGPDPWPGQLGEPGHFTWTRGTSPDAQARWGQYANQWSGVLQPNALLRVYQGYGGQNLALKGSGGVGDGPAITNGYVMLTGVFLIDTVSVDSGTSSNRGPMLHFQCRDMFKLLIDQQLYPPLVPSDVYPLFYTRGGTDVIAGYTTPPAAAGAWQTKRCVWVKSGNDVWYGVNASVDGHRPTDSIDGNPATFWLSVGNAGPQYPFAVEWLEFDVQEDINGVWIYPWAGNYLCWISVMVGGAWQGSQTIPYSTGGVGRYVGAYNEAIPFVMNFGTGWETAQWVALPARYHAERVRFSFSNLVRSPWGPYEYRAGVRELAVGDNGAALSTTVGPTTKVTPANYVDYVDVVTDILLWSGFWLYDPTVPGSSQVPQVYGNLESTGAPGSGSPVDNAVLGNDFFEKKAPIDPLKALRDVVGYILRCDGAGAARFESPNWWSSGNFFDDGTDTEIIPVLDERLNVTDFTVAGSDAALRSEIITAMYDPALVPAGGTPISLFIPSNAVALRGLVKPAMLGLLSNATQTDANVLAELIALQIWFIQRQGTVTAVFRPDIDIDTQVRIFDRVSGETYVHYVRGVHTDHNLDTGVHTMTLTTNWLGDRNNWAITTDPASFGFPISATLQNFIAAQAGRKTNVFRVGAARGVTIVTPPTPPTPTSSFTGVSGSGVTIVNPYNPVLSSVTPSSPPYSGPLTHGINIRQNPSLVGIQVPVGTLVSHTGDFTPAVGQHVDSMWIHGNLILNTNCLVTNCNIDGGVQNYPSPVSGAKVQYCNIGIGYNLYATDGPPVMVFYGRYTIQFCNIQGTGTDIVRTNDVNTIIDGNHLHGFQNPGIAGDHADLLQSDDPCPGCQVTRNWFHHDSIPDGEDASIIWKSDNGTWGDGVIDSNYFSVDATDSHGTAIVPWNQSLVIAGSIGNGFPQAPTPIQVTNNYWQKGVWGTGGVYNDGSGTPGNFPSTLTPFSGNMWVNAAGAIIRPIVAPSNFPDGNYPNTT